MAGGGSGFSREVLPPKPLILPKGCLRQDAQAAESGRPKMFLQQFAQHCRTVGVAPWGSHHGVTSWGHIVGGPIRPGNVIMGTGRTDVTIFSLTLCASFSISATLRS